MNGGFEISKNDLPVNWLMYSPNTVPNADFEIELDKNIFKEGNQSLRFDVKNKLVTVPGGGILDLRKSSFNTFMSKFFYF